MRSPVKTRLNRKSAANIIARRATQNGHSRLEITKARRYLIGTAFERYKAGQEVSIAEKYLLCQAEVLRATIKGKGKKRKLVVTELIQPGETEKLKKAKTGLLGAYEKGVH